MGGHEEPSTNSPENLFIVSKTTISMLIKIVVKIISESLAGTNSLEIHILYAGEPH